MSKARKAKRPERSEPPVAANTFEQGLALFRRGDYREAIRRWQGLSLGEREQNHLAEAHFRRALEKPGNLPVRLEHLEKAVGLRSDWPLYRHHLALACWQAGQRERALREAEEAVRLSGGEERFVLHHHLLRHLADPGFVCAPKDWRCPLLGTTSRRPRWYSALEKFLAALEKGDVPTATASLDRLSGTKTPPEILSTLAPARIRILLLTGRDEEAAGLLQKEGEGEGEERQVLLRSRLQRALSRENGQEAMAALSALAGSRSFPPATERALWVHVGRLLFAGKSYPEAAIAWTRAYGSLPLDQALALAHQMAESYEEANRYWERVVRQKRKELRGEDRQILDVAYRQLAENDIEGGNLEAAARHLEQLLSLGPTADPEVYPQLLGIYSALEVPCARKRELARAWAKADTADPEPSEYLFDEAVKHGDLPEALTTGKDWLNRCVEEEERENAREWIYQSLGDLYLRLARFAEILAMEEHFGPIPEVSLPGTLQFMVALLALGKTEVGKSLLKQLEKVKKRIPDPLLPVLALGEMLAGKSSAANQTGEECLRMDDLEERSKALYDLAQYWCIFAQTQAETPRGDSCAASEACQQVSYWLDQTLERGPVHMVVHEPAGPPGRCPHFRRMRREAMDGLLDEQRLQRMMEEVMRYDD